MGSHRVGHDRSNLAAAAACIKSKLNPPKQKIVNKKFRNKSNRKTKSMKCFAKEKK